VKNFKNIITPEEASALDKEMSNAFLKRRDTPDVVSRIVKLLCDYYEVEICDKSFWRVEIEPKGHDWHVDKGNRGHMAWCQVGASVLLSNDFEGGDTHYKWGKVDREIYELISHSSDIQHKVDPHTGNRRVLLIFI